MNSNQATKHFRASAEISEWIKKKGLRSFIEIGGNFAFGGLIIFAFYQRTEDFSTFLLQSSGVIALLFFFTFYMTYKTAVRVNRTISEVEINENRVTFRTFPYSLFGLKNYSPIVVEGELGQLPFREKSHPFTTKPFHGRSQMLYPQEKEIYLLWERFDRELEDLLKQKTETKPEYLV